MRTSSSALGNFGAKTMRGMLAPLRADHAHERDAFAGRAAEVVGERERAPARDAGDLPLARLAAQLQPALEQHPQTGGADRVAERLQPAVGIDGQLALQVEVPARTSFQPVPRAAKPRSSISTSSVGVKQSCTSAMASSWRGSLMPACA